MNIPTAGRRLSAAVLTTTLAVTGWTAVTAAPAAAHAYTDRAPLSAWVYTDSRDPGTGVNVLDRNLGTAPLGSWRDADGKHHISRSYVTFDLSAYVGKKVSAANVYFEERKVADCSKRSVEIWSTTNGPVTWANPPTEVAMLGADRVGEGICPRIIGTEVTELVRNAVLVGRRSVSLEIRVGADVEGDVAYGRSILNSGNSIALSVASNTPPTVDSTKLFTAYRPCSREPRPSPLPSSGMTLSAMFADADSHDEYNLTAEWAIWPADHPEQRTVLTERARNGYQSGVFAPSSLFAQGRTYNWQTRVFDGSDYSEWSATCAITIDAVNPASAPQIVSPTFPESEWAPGGTPGAFTLSAGGDTDVVGFQYNWTGSFGVPVVSTDDRGTPIWHDPFDLPGYVRANAPGGSASVMLSPPGNVNTLYVRSIDAAGNVGPQATYRVFVADTSPRLTVDGAESPSGVYEVDYGSRLTVRFTPHPGISPIVEYSYRLDDRQWTVTPGPDGTAEVTIIAEGSDIAELAVRGRSANGWVSPEYKVFLSLLTGPKVTGTVNGVGEEAVFVLAPRLPGTAAYTYQFDYGEYATTAAGADGTAKVSWTPTSAGSHVLTVWAVDADGNWLTYTDYTFDVA
ncbi:MAG: hypothetical protein HOU81_17770 [Hamadaea sp.]|uniref:hypothetical protein n=1 Tax=Hamadaea sp. TaxID=2024425 RepID=UPI0018055DEA|nr:hypothetical protein [Hamadaea sp.]NUR72669.1 hypothetical protein [Hamadaea sp.]NUT21134.1 hypothetical protein [Hamadaea sp.]